MEDSSESAGSPRRSNSSASSVFVRAIGAPDVACRLRIYSEPEPLSEVEITAPGAVVATRDVTPEVFEQFAQQLHEFPRPDFGAGSDAVEIQLEAADGIRIKSGSGGFARAGARAIMPLDAATRRFRLGGRAPGVDAILRRAAAAAEHPR